MDGRPAAVVCAVPPGGLQREACMSALEFRVGLVVKSFMVSPVLRQLPRLIAVSRSVAWLTQQTPWQEQMRHAGRCKRVGIGRFCCGSAGCPALS
jgi:hypothetical protein